MIDKLLFWIAIVACISYVFNLVLLVTGHTFDNYAIAISFIANVLFYGIMAYICHGNNKSKEESE